ncbi:MAG: hypothetical protein NTU44_13165, partial [Bacteroidetes bacterium]|nr:hypothetical protein [Bacteroidota bacterium]
MKRTIFFLTVIFMTFALGCSTSKQNIARWPLVFKSGGSEVKVFPPIPESLNKNVLDAYATISVKNEGDADPAFGTFWFSGIMKEGDNKNDLRIENMDITDFTIPGIKDTAKLIQVKSDLVKQLIASGAVFSRDSITTTLNRAGTDLQRTQAVNSVAPDIIY